MMKVETIEHQILPVLQLVRERCGWGEEVRKAYRAAVRDVAKRTAVTYQTIGDGCRRRMKLRRVGDLYTLLEQWVEGDANPLTRQLKLATDSSAHDTINKFFSLRNEFDCEGIPKAAHAATGKSETFSFTLPEYDARRLRALAEIEGTSPAAILSQIVGIAVADRLKSVV